MMNSPLFRASIKDPDVFMLFLDFSAYLALNKLFLTDEGPSNAEAMKRLLNTSEGRVRLREFQESMLEYGYGLNDPNFGFELLLKGKPVTPQL